MSSSDLVSKSQGESERLVKNLFAMARAEEHAIIFVGRPSGHGFATRIVRGAVSRRRRGCRADSPNRESPKTVFDRFRGVGMLATSSRRTRRRCDVSPRTIHAAPSGRRDRLALRLAERGRVGRDAAHQDGVFGPDAGRREPLRRVIGPRPRRNLPGARTTGLAAAPPRPVSCGYLGRPASAD